MYKQNGITLVALTVTIIVMIIIASITAYYSKDLIKEAKLQDLRTNMLLIQAKAKECVEEANFQKLEFDNDADALKDILIGEKVNESTEVTNAVNAANLSYCTGDQYYYLSLENLKDMGLKDDLNVTDYGYFIVEYDIENIKVDVINTKGYQGLYRLTDINASISEE